MKEKKIITCASYGGTGSSAITDLLKEFDIVKSLGSYEFAITHEVDGISDLQHNLVDDWHRLKNDEAIYRFKKLSKRYSKECNEIFNNKFDGITNEYIDSLIDFVWSGYWHQHEVRVNGIKAFFYYKLPKFVQLKTNAIINKVLLAPFKRNKHSYEYVPKFKKDKMYFAKPNDNFIKLTRKYFDDLFFQLDKEENYEYLALDQVVPPTNTNRYLNYFNDMKVIIVDRDPRDLYILNKLFWKEAWILTHDIDVYIKWFKLMREHQKTDNINSEKVLIVKFEDLVFNYESEIKKIEEFLKLKEENHINKKRFFNPEKSINNTRLWLKYTCFNEDINKIEEELSEFCYKL